MFTVAPTAMYGTDEAPARRVRLFKFHGVSRDAWKAYGAAASLHYDTVLAGFKYNLTDMASSLGIHQLRKLDGFIDRRAAIARRYLLELAGIPGLRLPILPSWPHRHAWHLFTVLAVGRSRLPDLLLPPRGLPGRCGLRIRRGDLRGETFALDLVQRDGVAGCFPSGNSPRSGHPFPIS